MTLGFFVQIVKHVNSCDLICAILHIIGFVIKNSNDLAINKDRIIFRISEEFLLREISQIPSPRNSTNAITNREDYSPKIIRIIFFHRNILPC